MAEREYRGSIKRVRRLWIIGLTALSFGAGSIWAHTALAVEQLRFQLEGGNADLEDTLRSASLVVRTVEEQRKSPEGVLAAALSDYGNLIGALYANGYYSGVVQIRLDGREAAQIALLRPPAQITTVDIRIQPGRQFTFGRVEILPAPQTTDLTLPKPGDIARSSEVRAGVAASIAGWRNLGYAQAAPASERIVADHPRAVLDVGVKIAPGPLVRFGRLDQTTPSAVRAARIQRIAGLPAGDVFSPAILDKVTTRLRRTGAFSSVSLSEAETLGPGNSMDIALRLADAKPRRFGFGAEVSSFEGLELSAFWLHRNLLGGAERLRLDGEISDIGGQDGGIDYTAGLRFEVPAALGPDTTVFALTELERLDEPSFETASFTLGVGATKIFSDTFEAEIGVNIEYSETDDALGERDFTRLAFPVKGTWDLRDDDLNTQTGAYLAATLTPFVGLGGTKSGLRTELDARAYRSIGSRVVLAGRIQLGSVVGPALTEAQPDDLFFSGGGGTVRGQPFQSLDIDLGGGNSIGGRSFLGLSGEVRVDITNQIGAVAFADAGYIGSEALIDGSGDWHSGAGLGLRYQTGLGPIRLDLAGPLSGDTGDGLQIYIGIGQAF